MFTTCEQPVYIPSSEPEPSRARVSDPTSNRTGSKSLREPYGNAGADAHTHSRAKGEHHGRNAAYRKWRKAKFGDECIDPVAVAVDDAVKAFSRRDPEQDRRVWLSVANRIGVEAFRAKTDEMHAIVKSYSESDTPLANPAAMFQGLLNSRTKHGKQINEARDILTGNGGAK